MKFYNLFLLTINISLIFCLEPNQECEILNNYSSYFDDINCCKNENIECNESQSHIIRINLRNSIRTEMRDNFSLGTFLNQFPALEWLDISNNGLSGDLIIPYNTTLVELNASENSFDGKFVIPDNSEIETFFSNGESKLRVLNINSNYFKGNLIIPKNSSLTILLLQRSLNLFSFKLYMPTTMNFFSYKFIFVPSLVIYICFLV
ncbi:hypothetical protein LY90DRAFT_289009 [Neocallimastix californiae]|uniref:L domain-like protein n=1 Tax=Neocallimastix californiae TaxID=1754190 RepID=A0A1Y2CYX8_9FUNG|nr:hypothetical protein LY90DRAFT_289009 [Neocallimastix californiae]|eukprot:ORY52157.1 hypothetical protein LY90DRAFT_289009 [Neocallimastix californiae]